MDVVQSGLAMQPDSNAGVDTSRCAQSGGALACIFPSPSFFLILVSRRSEISGPRIAKAATCSCWMHSCRARPSKPHALGTPHHAHHSQAAAGNV
jgi:hypothetical protein